MRRGTTPIIIFNVDIDLTEAEVVYVTFRQNKENIVEKDKSECTIESSRIIVPLTQEDTLLFGHDPRQTVCAQIRARFTNGEAIASNILQIRVKDILKDGEI